MKALNVLVALVLGVLTQVGYAQQGSNQTVFGCDLVNGKSILLAHDAKTDTFILKYGTDLAAPEVLAVKLGNDMGTANHYSSLTHTAAREVYLRKGDDFYTVGYVDRGEHSEGYFQFTQGTVEKAYSECKPATLNSTFGDTEQFANMTEVD